MASLMKSMDPEFLKVVKGISLRRLADQDKSKKPNLETFLKHSVGDGVIKFPDWVGV